jgi:transcriptional regulator with XRE-family HTH domain
MKKVKLIDSDKLFDEFMKDERYAKEYNDLDDDFEIAREVIRLRVAARLTQRELARLAGTSQPAIARLESGGYRNLSLSSLRKIGMALGVKPTIHFEKIQKTKNSRKSSVMKKEYDFTGSKKNSHASKVKDK